MLVFYFSFYDPPSLVRAGNNTYFTCKGTASFSWCALNLWFVRGASWATGEVLLARAIPLKECLTAAYTLLATYAAVVLVFLLSKSYIARPRNSGHWPFNMNQACAIEYVMLIFYLYSENQSQKPKQMISLTTLELAMSSLLSLVCLLDMST